MSLSSPRVRRAFAALSYANLCFVKVWTDTLLISSAEAYYWIHSPSRQRISALLTCIFLLAGAGYLLSGWLRERRWAQYGLFCAMLVPLNAFRLAFADHLPWLRTNNAWIREAPLLTAVLAAAAVFAVWKYAELLARAIPGVLLALSPFLAVTIPRAIYEAATYQQNPFRDRPTARPVSSSPPPVRAVWIVFDELDQRLTFDERPPDVALPEFDRLRSESVYANRAFSPAEVTSVAMPALITGQRLASSEPLSARELRLVYPDGRSSNWSETPGLFAAARAMGFDTAVAGWYHPYCRVLAHELTFCRWWSNENEATSLGDDFGSAIPRHFRALFETSLISPFGQSLSTAQRVRTWREMLPAAMRAAADPKFGLVLLHLPVPHAPHPWDRRTRDFTLANSPFQGYADSLALADWVLGGLRSAMIESGVWDRTALLVTSDHSYREAPSFDGKRDPRVPFLLRLPHAQGRTDVTSEVQTLRTRDLLLGILSGEVRTPEQAVRRLAPL